MRKIILTIVMVLALPLAAFAGHEEWCHFDQGVPGEQRGSISKGHGHEHHEHDFLIETEEDRDRCLGTTTTTSSTTTTVPPTTTTVPEPENGEQETTTTIEFDEEAEQETTTSQVEETSSQVVEAPATERTELPFTGLPVPFLVGLAAALMATGGLLIRRGQA